MLDQQQSGRRQDGSHHLAAVPLADGALANDDEAIALAA
jgi:hypothetical protein